MESKRTATSYYIPPGKFLLMENALGNPDLIQSSVAGDCRVTMVDKETFPLDELEQWPTFRLVASDIKLNLGNGVYYIYLVVPTPDYTEGTSAFISYHTKQVDKDGFVESGERLGKPGLKYYTIGSVTAQGANPSATTTPSGRGRSIEVDLGVTPAPSTLPGYLNDFDKIFRVDKVDSSNVNSWLLTILVTIKQMVARVVHITDRLIFGQGENEKALTGVATTADKEDKDAVSDTTIATTAWVSEKFAEISEDRFLSKVHPDRTEHLVQFGDGIETGTFVSGMSGSGARVDGSGHGEMRSLTLHEFLEVPELRFNRVDVVSGELWNSVGFGLVESVDAEHFVCNLKLEQGEYATLQVMDICRGIFNNFGNGDSVDGFDDNGFTTLRGFSTSYFTPIEILHNEAGRFQFRYQLQEGTSVHPCASMKFAVYGNFVDESRQASAYSTRTYKRYLNKVNTWAIDPDRNIYSQFGLLDGLTIGGQKMSGYGSYQHNCYLSGAFVQFTPQQKEELKGEDAYTATLSDYEGIVVLDDEGGIVGGEQMLMNVITEGKNVVTDGENVITAMYKLRTQVQAMRGTSVLHHSLGVEKDAYVIALNPVGCTAMVLNGVVVVTSVTEPNNCHVGITVNCEGKAVFNLDYHITAVTDGKNPIVADMDNEVDAVACDPDGNVLFGLPVSTRVSMWAGSKQLILSRLDVDAPEGVVVKHHFVDQNGKPLDERIEEGDELEEGQVPDEPIQYTTAVVTIPAKATVGEGEAATEVPGISREAARSLPIRLTAHASYGGNLYHKDLVFTVNKIIAGENAVIYKLHPSVSSIVIDKEDKPSVSSIRCDITGYDGKQSHAMTGLPAGYRMEYAVNEGDVKGEYVEYVYQSEVAVTKDTRQVAFRLYQVGGEGKEDVLVDAETVPVIRDGVQIRSVVAYTRSKETPATPEGGSFANPKPETAGWSLTAPDGEAMLWSSFRTFTSNGLPPQDEAWSAPVRVSDTASFKVIWSSSEDRPVLDKAAPEFNTEYWTDDPSGDAVWMATSTMVNEVWTPWQVVKVKGADALQLIASTGTISRNSFGTYQPDKVLVRALRGGKDEEMYLGAWGVDAKGVRIEVKKADVKRSSIEFTPASFDSKNFASVVFRAFSKPHTEYTDEDMLCETSILYVGDGASGPMPRNCGEYNESTRYYYNNTYRDFVWHNDKTAGTKVYMREGFGKAYAENDADGGISGIAPTNSTYWVEVHKSVMTAIDTALIDTANIAGFVYKDLLMVSQDWEYDNPSDKTGLDATIILDGKTGFFKCSNADVRGSITAGSLSYKIKTGGGSLDGYTMAYGAGTYTLPSIPSGSTLVLSAYCPSVSSDGLSSPFVLNTKGNSVILKYDESKGYATTVSRAELEHNKIYSVIGVGLAITGDPLDGNVSTWFIGSSIGGSGASIMVDDYIDDSMLSTNPVQNRVIASKFDELEKKLGDKVKKISSTSELTDEPILYIL